MMKQEETLRMVKQEVTLRAKQEETLSDQEETIRQLRDVVEVLQDQAAASMLNPASQMQIDAGGDSMQAQQTVPTQSAPMPVIDVSSWQNATVNRGSPVKVLFANEAEKLVPPPPPTRPKVSPSSENKREETPSSEKIEATQSVHGTGTTKEADFIKLDPIPTPVKFRLWKSALRDQVSGISPKPDAVFAGYALSRKPKISKNSLMQPRLYPSMRSLLPH